MERVEIYTSKKKALGLLLLSLPMTILGVLVFVCANGILDNKGYSPVLIRVVGAAIVSFFGLGIWVSFKQIISDMLVLVIDNAGIGVNPRKYPSHRIEWKNIDGFSEIMIKSSRIVIINVNNSYDWIDNEKNAIKRKIMEYNVLQYGSPFNISAVSMQVSHAQLMKILNENLLKYKP